MLCLSRSHDGFQEKSDGVLEPAGGSSYASQRRVFEDLGQGVLDNAFEGNEQIFKRIIFYIRYDYYASIQCQMAEFLAYLSFCVCIAYLATDF